MRKKLTLIIKQWHQYRQTGKYWQHYFWNICRIIFHLPIIDYRHISHENKLVRHQHII